MYVLIHEPIKSTSSDYGDVRNILEQGDESYVTGSIIKFASRTRAQWAITTPANKPELHISFLNTHETKWIMESTGREIDIANKTYTTRHLDLNDSLCKAFINLCTVDDVVRRITIEDGEYGEPPSIMSSDVTDPGEVPDFSHIYAKGIPPLVDPSNVSEYRSWLDVLADIRKANPLYIASVYTRNKSCIYQQVPEAKKGEPEMSISGDRIAGFICYTRKEGILFDMTPISVIEEQVELYLKVFKGFKDVRKAE